MRTDPRYGRVREILNHESIPRMRNGGIKLCHCCQREIYFAGGFLELLIRRLIRCARHAKYAEARRVYLAKTQRTA